MKPAEKRPAAPASAHGPRDFGLLRGSTDPDVATHLQTLQARKLQARIPLLLPTALALAELAFAEAQR